MRQQTMTLNDVPEASRFRHVHGVNVHLAKQRCRGGDDGRYEDIPNLLKLTGATSPDEPMYVSVHQPPKPYTDQHIVCVKTLVSYFVMT